MPIDQSTENEPEAVDLSPKPATAHLSAIIDHIPVVPERRGIWPLAPWRAIVLLMAIFFAVTCAVPAADPIWNGADLGVLISLALFVAVFTPGRD